MISTNGTVVNDDICKISITSESMKRLLKWRGIRLHSQAKNHGQARMWNVRLYFKELNQLQKCYSVTVLAQIK
jgi:hypothetical protein